MKIELNTNLIPLFSGTYNSIWEVTEYNEEGTEEVEVDYKHEDLIKSIIEVYKKNEKYILSELNCAFIKDIKFSDTFFSPREYNFKTDELDFTIEIDEDKLLNTLHSLKNDSLFHKFLKDNYSSYDGFMSFTPNNYKEIAENIKNNGQDYIQALSAIITYLAKENIKIHGGVSIEEMIYDDWQGNGYYGLDYKIVTEEI